MSNVYSPGVDGAGSANVPSAVLTLSGVVADTVAEHGGRLVKTIGDEVLYAADDPAVAVAIAVDLMHRAASAGLPPLRAGMDHGPAVWFEGDLFGSTVNRAARLVAEAPAGAIAASQVVRGRAPTHDWSELGMRHLKGVGDVPVQVLEVVAG